MALPCPECGTSIPEGDKLCPRCGLSPKSPGPLLTTRWKIFILLWFVVILGWFAWVLVVS